MNTVPTPIHRLQQENTFLGNAEHSPLPHMPHLQESPLPAWFFQKAQIFEAQQFAPSAWAYSNMMSASVHPRPYGWIQGQMPSKQTWSHHQPNRLYPLHQLATAKWLHCFWVQPRMLRMWKAGSWSPEVFLSTDALMLSPLTMLTNGSSSSRCVIFLVNMPQFPSKYDRDLMSVSALSLSHTCPQIAHLSTCMQMNINISSIRNSLHISMWDHYLNLKWRSSLAHSNPLHFCWFLNQASLEDNELCITFLTLIHLYLLYPQLIILLTQISFHAHGVPFQQSASPSGTYLQAPKHPFRMLLKPTGPFLLPQNSGLDLLSSCMIMISLPSTPATILALHQLGEYMGSWKMLQLTFSGHQELVPFQNGSTITSSSKFFSNTSQVTITRDNIGMCRSWPTPGPEQIVVQR